MFTFRKTNGYVRLLPTDNEGDFADTSGAKVIPQHRRAKLSLLCVRLCVSTLIVVSLIATVRIHFSSEESLGTNLPLQSNYSNCHYADPTCTVPSRAAAGLGNLFKPSHVREKLGVKYFCRGRKAGTTPFLGLLACPRIAV